MKKFLAVLISLFVSISVLAQTWDEWTAQKKTQIKYLLEQIAALRIYGNQLKKGYDIVQEGLSTIHSIKQGDFNLHEGFFAALKKVNPKIRNYPKLASILYMQLIVFRECKDVLKWAKESKQLNDAEISYISTVISHLVDDCTKVIDALILFTTDDRVELKDDERLNRIDALYAEIQDQFLFIQHFGQETKILVSQRLREQKEVHQSRILNEIK